MSKNTPNILEKQCTKTTRRNISVEIRIRLATIQWGAADGPQGCVSAPIVTDPSYLTLEAEILVPIEQLKHWGLPKVKQVRNDRVRTQTPSNGALPHSKAFTPILYNIDRMQLSMEIKKEQTEYKRLL